MTTKNETPKPQKKAGRAAQNFMDAAADFEKSKSETLRTNNRRLWAFSIATLGFASLAVIALLVAMLMRKDPEPWILQVDKATGSMTVVKHVNQQDATVQETIDRYWLGRYVMLREAYDWYTLNDQFSEVMLMSGSAVGSEYSKAVQAKDSPLEQFKDRKKVLVKINSLTFIGTTAQVRFTKTVLSPTGELDPLFPPSNWIATIAAEYGKRDLTEAQRLTNPLDFQVMSYRVDSERVQ